jgi:hypothetical protein
MQFEAQIPSALACAARRQPVTGFEVSEKIH